MPAAVHPCGCTVHASTAAAAQPPREHDPETCPARFSAAERRTGESQRAERAYQAYQDGLLSERPLSKWRNEIGGLLEKVAQRRGISYRRLADMIGVDRKVLEKYLDGRAYVPLAILMVLPVDMTLDLIDEMEAARSGGASGTRPSLMQRAIGGLRRSGDRTAMVAAIAELAALANTKEAR